jgi:hypothetical protein
LPNWSKLCIETGSLFSSNLLWFLVFPHPNMPFQPVEDLPLKLKSS